MAKPKHTNAVAQHSKQHATAPLSGQKKGQGKMGMLKRRRDDEAKAAAAAAADSDSASSSLDSDSDSGEIVHAAKKRAVVPSGSSMRRRAAQAMLDSDDDENDEGDADDASSVSSGEGELRQYADADGLSDSDDGGDDGDRLNAGLQQEQLIEQLLSRRVDQQEYASSDDDDADDDESDSDDDDDDSTDASGGGNKLMKYLRSSVFGDEEGADDDDVDGDDDDDDDDDDATADAQDSLLANESRYLQKSMSGSGSAGGHVELRDLLASLNEGASTSSATAAAGGASARASRVTKGAEELSLKENIASLKKIVKEKERGDIHRDLADDQGDIEERRAAFDLVDAHMEKWHPVVNSLEEARRVPIRYKDGPRVAQRGQMQQSKPQVLDAFDHELEVKIEKQRQRKMAAAADADAATAALDERPADLFGFVEPIKNSKKMSKRELMEKTNEIRQRRLRMQEEQRKFAHLKKIKSKSYRRILKKDREKEEQKKMEGELEHMDSEELRDRLLKEERALLKERMTLKHKNQSGWIRRALKVAHTHQNKDLHHAISDQLHRGEELRKRQTGTMHEESDEEDEVVDRLFESGEHPAGSAQTTLSHLKQEIQDRAEEDKSEEQGGLFGMEFMKKARERKRQQQMDLLQQMEKDVLGSTAGADEDDAPKIFGRRVFTSVSAQAPPRPVVLASAAKRPAETAQAAAGTTGASQPIVQVSKLSTGTAITVKLNDNNIKAPAQQASAPSKPVVLEVVNVAAAPAATAGLAGRKRKAVEKEEAASSDDADEENPWLKPSDANFKEDRASKRQKKDKEQNEAELRVNIAQLMRDEQDDEDAAPAHREHESSDTDKLKQFMQSVKKQAFAEDDVQLEFGTEKQRTIDMEVDLPELESSVKPGWGDWAGKGTDYKEKHTKRLKQIDTVKDKLRKTKAQERPDRDKAHVIIRQSAAIPDKYINKHVAGSKEAVRKIYDTATAHPIGAEWNSFLGTRRNVRPRVEVKTGAIVAPLKYKDAYVATKKHHEMEQKAIHGAKDEREDPMAAETDRIRKNYEEVKVDRTRRRDATDKAKFDRIREKQQREERARLIQ